MKRPANDKLKSLSEELGEMLNLGKYGVTFFYRGEKVGMNERLGDRDIGCKVGSFHKQMPHNLESSNENTSIGL